MNGTRVFVTRVFRTQAWGTIVTGELSMGSKIFVGQYLDLFDSGGEWILSTKVLGLEQNGNAVETATKSSVDIKLDNVIDADIDIDSVLLGVSASSELLMHRSENLNYAVGY